MSIMFKPLETLAERVEVYAVAGPAQREFLETYDMITLPDSLIRIWTHAQRKQSSFGIISGFTAKDISSEEDIDQMISNTLAIATQARRLDLSYVWLKGYWQGIKMNTQIPEDALLIFGDDRKPQELKNFFLEMIKQYHQEVFALKPKGNDHLYGIHPDGRTDDYGIFQADRLVESYTQLRNDGTTERTFVLASVWGIQTPQNHRAIMARLKAGVDS